MSDDLVKRLQAYRPTNEWGDPVHHWICDEAAARILELEAGLATAVDALEFYGGHHECPNEGPWGIDSTDFGNVARQALTTLKENQDG
jgi:hypothetical protein